MCGITGVSGASEGKIWVGSFIGGFINGIINTTGLVAALATGGSWAYIIAVVSGFTGGYFGSMANQSISYGSIDRSISFANGVVSKVSNGMVLYGSNTFMNPLIGETWGARFVEAILP